MKISSRVRTGKLLSDTTSMFLTASEHTKRKEFQNELSPPSLFSSYQKSASNQSMESTSKIGMHSTLREGKSYRYSIMYVDKGWGCQGFCVFCQSTQPSFIACCKPARQLLTLLCSNSIGLSSYLGLQHAHCQDCYRQTLVYRFNVIPWSSIRIEKVYGDRIVSDTVLFVRVCMQRLDHPNREILTGVKLR